MEHWVKQGSFLSRLTGYSGTVEYQLLQAHRPNGGKYPYGEGMFSRSWRQCLLKNSNGNQHPRVKYPDARCACLLRSQRQWQNRCNLAKYKQGNRVGLADERVDHQLRWAFPAQPLPNGRFKIKAVTTQSIHQLQVK